MGASAVLEGFASAGERQHFSDHRLQLPLIDELRDLIQLSSIPANDELYASQGVLLGDAGRNG